MFKVRMFLPLTPFVVALTLSGTPAPAQDGGEVTLHAVRSGKLRDIMGQMNTLLYEREHTALELDLLRSRYLRALAVAVEDLTREADDLDSLLEGSPLPAPEQARFRELVDQLHTRVVRLQVAAEGGDLSALNDAYGRVVETCDGCHGLFRSR